MSVLLVLAALEAMLLVTLWLPAPVQPPIGFLVKNGKRYLLVYRGVDEQFEMRPYDTLNEALHHAKEDLRLAIGPNPVPSHELEHAWVTPRSGRWVLLWKALHAGNVSQITFDKEQDAELFLAAFRRGSYSPSLFGHSVLLRTTARIE